MTAYAPARDDGLFPYVVTTSEFAGARTYTGIVWAKSLRDAKAAYGWTLMEHTRKTVRRARVEDMPKGGDR